MLGWRESGILGQREQKANWLKIVFGHVQLSVAKNNQKNFLTHESAILCEDTTEVSDFCTMLASILKITTKLFYSFMTNISMDWELGFSSRLKFPLSEWSCAPGGLLLSLLILILPSLNGAHLPRHVEKKRINVSFLSASSARLKHIDPWSTLQKTDC